MGIDGMRVAGGRCPPLLVGGLLFACLMLICKWWTLSSENIELVRQIDELNEQLKISVEERDQCVTFRTNLEYKFKHADNERASLHVRLEQQNELKKKNDELEHSVLICKSELDSLHKLDATKTLTLNSLRLEKDTINTQLDVKNDQNKKLREEVEQLKEELSTVKLSCNKVAEKKPKTTLQPTRPVINDKTQLGPVPASAVRVSVAGVRGLQYHGIPILPADPPGAVRQSPRFSVTMLKADTSAKQQKNDTANETTGQNTPDPGDENLDNSNQGGGGTIDTESERDQQMKVPTDLDKPEDEK